MTKSPEERASTICRAYKFTSGNVQELIVAHIKEAEEAARQKENTECVKLLYGMAVDKAHAGKKAAQINYECCRCYSQPHKGKLMK